MHAADVDVFLQRDVLDYLTLAFLGLSALATTFLGFATWRTSNRATAIADSSARTSDLAFRASERAARERFVEACEGYALRHTGNRGAHTDQPNRGTVARIASAVGYSAFDFVDWLEAGWKALLEHPDASNPRFESANRDRLRTELRAVLRTWISEPDGPPPPAFEPRAL